MDDPIVIVAGDYQLIGYDWGSSKDIRDETVGMYGYRNSDGELVLSHCIPMAYIDDPILFIPKDRFICRGWKDREYRRPKRRKFHKRRR